MSRALEIAKACVPSARSELPLDSHARAILVGVAADLIQAELDRVTAQVKDLTEALRPFAMASSKFGETYDGYRLCHICDLELRDLRKARSVIEAEIKT